MSDENLADGSTPAAPAQGSGVFDWLRESHQQSVPLAPLSEDVPSPAAAQPVPPSRTQSAGSASPSFADLVAAWTPESAASESVPLAPPTAATPLPPAAPPTTPEPTGAPLLIPRPGFMSRIPAEQPPPPAPTVAAQPPVEAVPAPAQALVPDPAPGHAVPPPAASLRPSSLPPISVAPAAPSADPLAFSFTAPDPDAADSAQSALRTSVFGVEGLKLERRESASRSKTGPLDVAALVLAIVLPPVGLVLGIVAVIIDSRTRGFVASAAKAAIVVASVLTIVAAIGGGVFAKISADQMAHNAVVASSTSWCSKLEANPATLSSDTFGWPAPADTVPDSITAMQTYVTFWKGLERVAPSGIKAGTAQVEATANSIYTSVNATQTLDDAADISQMQAAAANSGVQAWVTEYCK